MKGAPLRFAAAVVGGWVVGRVVVLLPAAVPLVAPVIEEEARVIERVTPVDMVRTPDVPIRHAIPLPHTAVVKVTQAIAAPSNRPTEIGSIQPTPPIPTYRLPPTTPAAVETAATVSPRSPTPSSPLHIDAWLVARPGGGDNLAFGQLGASQGGARLTYALDRRVALSGRVSAPLRGTAREVGVGVDLQPTHLPLHVLVEQRIDLDTGSARPAVVAIAGGSIALPGRVRIDAYGQVGAVRRRGRFVDAAAIIAHPLVTRGDTRLELGGGTWGAAQRGVARLDIGPSIALVTPGAGGTLRLQLDYRARVAGRARPGSGPALTLGGSF